MLPLDDQARIHVRRWPTERPLLLLNALASAGLWFLFFRSPQSLAYLAMWVAIIGLMNVAFVTSIRGSAVRLGSDQFPDLHARVEDLARRVGLRRIPNVYLMQHDGALNAFAMRFVRTHMVVLFSDLLEACGDSAAARDMIIGHELGHIRAGHLRGRWLLMPASFVPFLGSALSLGLRRWAVAWLATLGCGLFTVLGLVSIWSQQTTTSHQAGPGPGAGLNEQVIGEEWQGGAQGELGWSAEWRKLALGADEVRRRGRLWREYCCESFCDTAAWRYSGLKKHPEFTLAGNLRRRRAQWMEDALGCGPLSI